MKHMNPWEWRCPNGHTSYRPLGGRYKCQSCKRYGDGDGWFETLVHASEFS